MRQEDLDGAVPHVHFCQNDATSAPGWQQRKRDNSPNARRFKKLSSTTYPNWCQSQLLCKTARDGFMKGW